MVAPQKLNRFCSPLPIKKGQLLRLCENSLRSWQNNRDMARGYFL